MNLKPTVTDEESAQVVRRVAVRVVSGLLFSVGVGNAVPILDPLTGHYYDVIESATGFSWFDAKSEAEALTFFGAPGHLTTITSQAENDFIFNSLPLISGENYWIGGFQPEGSPEPQGNWQWTTGEPFSFANWVTGEPNNFPSFAGPNEDGIHLIGVNGQWNDLNRNRGVMPDGSYGFIVEFEVSSVPDGAASTLSLALISLFLLAMSDRLVFRSCGANKVSASEGEPADSFSDQRLSSWF